MSLSYTGEKFGALTAIKKLAIKHKDGSYLWLFKCDCGKEVKQTPRYIKARKMPSCGCVIAEWRKNHASKLANNYLTKHGMHGKRTNGCWRAMKGRCKKNYNEAHLYYDRGIKVCKRWNDSFLAFYEDMGECPSNNHSLDRIDNNKGYEPGNVRWATSKEQANNKRNNVRIDWHGKKYSFSELSKKLGISTATLWHRNKVNRPLDKELWER